MTRRSRVAPLAAAVIVVAGCAGSSPGPAVEPSPPTRVVALEVSGPVDGGNGQATAAAQDLAALGYTESEFFFGSTATSYLPDGEQGADGRWETSEGESAGFRSRMIVRRPEDRTRFSGTVLVEWLNVTSGREIDPSWIYLAPEIAREGHAWVGVSAQQVGVAGLTTNDAARYGSLSHPGDGYAFDIFTQAGRALTTHADTAPLGDLEPEHILAVGASQSASYLSTYINGVHPVADVFDGFLVDRPLGSLASLTPTLPVRGAGSVKRIRTDLDEPTLIFVTETDLTVLGYARARQADTDSVRTWEVAGTAHGDAGAPGEIQSEGLAAFNASCVGRINEGPARQTLRAALHHLVTWLRTGEAPPVSPRIELAEPDDGPVRIERDEHGNALGGIRTPHVDVPLSTLSGEPVPGSPCGYFGSTIPFDADTLARLYPDHQSYVDAYDAATETAVAAGFILRPEADAMIAAAQG